MESLGLVCRWRRIQGFHSPENFCAALDSALRWVSIIIAMPRYSPRGAFPASSSVLVTLPRPTPPTNGFRWLRSNAHRHYCCAFCNLFLELNGRFEVESPMLAAKLEMTPMTEAT